MCCVSIWLCFLNSALQSVPHCNTAGREDQDLLFVPLDRAARALIVVGDRLGHGFVNGRHCILLCVLVERAVVLPLLPRFSPSASRELFGGVILALR